MANIKSFKDFVGGIDKRDKILKTKGSLKKGRTITGDAPTPVNLNPTLDKSNSLYEARNRTVVFNFGRLNPPTVGHEKLVNKITSVAKENNADAKLFLSRTEGDPKNPLAYSDKLKFARLAFGSIVQNTPTKMLPAGFLGILKNLEGRYNNVIIIVGSDRIADIKRLADRYNGKEYNYETIKVVSAGDRDPDAEDTSGMSASKMRSAALKGDFEAFKSGLPTRLKRSAKVVYNKVREELAEQFDGYDDDEEVLSEAKKKPKKAKPKGAKKLRVLTLQQRIRRRQAFRRMRAKIRVGRRRAMRMRATQDKLKRRARRMAIRMLRRRFAGGRNYADMGFAQRAVIDRLVQRRIKAVDRIATRLLPRLRAAEARRKIGGGFKSVSLVPIAKKPEVTNAQHAKQFKAKRPNPSAARIAAGGRVSEEIEQLHEGIYDPGIFKVIFMAGGPGSGKTTVTGANWRSNFSKLSKKGEDIDLKAIVPSSALPSLGFRMVSSDIPFEYMMKKAGLSMKMPPEEQPQRDIMRGKAKKVSKKIFDTYLLGRNGLIIDGTGHDTSAINQLKTALENIGYESAMMFVHTDLETAQERNLQRERIVPENVVRQRWNKVQKNKDAFRSMFGNMFLLINNSKNSDFASEMSNAFSKLSRWAKNPPSARPALAWISAQKKLRGITEEYLSEETLIPQVNKILDMIMEFNDFDIPASYLQEKADANDIGIEILEQVFKRGLCTWNESVGQSPTEHAMHRVNSFVESGLARKMDSDLYEAAKTKKPGAGEVGTDELVSTYLKDTPHSGNPFKNKLSLTTIVKEEIDVIQKIKYLLNKKQYDQAKKILIDLLRKKKKEGKSGRHSVEYYARRISSGVAGAKDVKILVDLVNKDYY